MEKKRRSIQVVLTREEKASVELSTKLRELLFKPIIFPTIQFTRVYPDYTGPQNFSDVGWIIFPTTRAVQYFFKRFRQKLDPTVKLCAISPAVQKEIEKNDYKVDVLTESNSVKSIEQSLANEKACKIIYPCAKSGRGKLLPLLGPRGFNVVELPLYDTEPPAEIDDSKLEMIKKGYYDVLTFASGSAVRHLMIILKGKVGVFKGKTAVVIGKEAESLLRGSTFSKVIRAKKNNADGLLEALVEYRKSLEQE